jgi:hypothetical protein
MPPRQNTSACKLGIFTSALLGRIHPALTHEGPIPPQRFETWAADPTTQAWLASKTTPHPRNCFDQGLELCVDPGTLPCQRHYIICAANRPSAFWTFYDRYRADPAWRTQQLDCLHDAMIEAPEALGDLLLGLGCAPRETVTKR